MNADMLYIPIVNMDNNVVVVIRTNMKAHCMSNEKANKAD